MSEKLSSSPIEDRIGNFVAKREENDTKAYYDSLIGDAGDTDTSDEAYDRLVEAQAYDSHMAGSKYVYDNPEHQQSATPEAMPTMAEVFNMATKAREAEALGDTTVSNDMVMKIDETLQNMTYEGELSVEEAEVIMKQIVSNIESVAPKSKPATIEQPKETNPPAESELDISQPEETQPPAADQLSAQQVKEFDNKRKADLAPTIDEEIFDFDRNRNELYTDFDEISVLLRAKEAASHNDKSTVFEIFNNTQNRLNSLVEAGRLDQADADRKFSDFKSLVGFEEAPVETPRYTADSPADTNATEVIETPVAEEEKQKTPEEQQIEDIEKTVMPTDEEMAELAQVGRDLGVDDAEKKPARRKLRERKLTRAAIKRGFAKFAARYKDDEATASQKDEEASAPKSKNGFATGRIAQFRRNQRRRQTELKLQDKKLAEEIEAKHEKERNA